MATSNTDYQSSLPPAPSSSSARYPKEYMDPDYWNPQHELFEIIDWDKFLAKNPAPPRVYDPPQRKSFFDSNLNIPLWWWNRSLFCKPLHRCVPGAKKTRSRISDDSSKLVKDMLGPSPNSQFIPEPFRNKLIWTEDNVAPETLVSFNRWAWRSQVEGGRVIGLGSLKYDWTVDNSCWGAAFGFFQQTRFATVQASPDGKWLALYTLSSPEKEGNYLFMYIVQEGDEFTTPDGKIIDNIKPGDIARLSWVGTDPYECDNSKLSYFYFPKVVATLNESTGVHELNDIHYANLLQNATNDSGKCCQTCCYTCTCCWSAEDRFEFQVNNINDVQVYAKAPSPPTAEAIDRL